MEIFQQLFALLLVFSSLFILFSRKSKIGNRLGKRFFRYTKAYLFILFVFLTGWLLSKSANYDGVQYLIMVAFSVVLMVKALLLARSKALDFIVQAMTTLPVWAIRLLALLQLLFAYLLLLSKV